MSNDFTMTKNYADGQLLLADDLDQMAFSLETFLNTTGITDDNIQNSGLIGDNITPASITVAKIAADSIATRNIQVSAVTNAKMGANSVITDTIIDGSVTRAKLEALNQQSLNFSTVVSGVSAVTLASISITTTGRPVFLTVPSFSYVSASANVTDNDFQQGASPSPVAKTTNLSFTIAIVRDSTLVYSSPVRFQSSDPTDNHTEERRIRIPSGAVSMIDSPSSGTYTYALKMLLNTTTMNGSGRGKLFAYEL